MSKNKKIHRILAAVMCAAVALSVIGTSCSGVKSDSASEPNPETSSAVIKSEPKICIAAEKYTMDITLDTNKNSLDEKIKVSVRNDTNEPVSVLYFRNMADSVLEHFRNEEDPGVNENKKSEIKSVTIGKSDKAKVQYEEDKSVFFVKLKKPISPSERVTVSISAKTDIPKTNHRFGYIKNKKGKSYALSFCFPYLAPNNDGEWNKDPYFHGGDTRASEISEYDVTFHAPDDYKIASTGSHTTKDGVTKVTAENVRDFALFVCNYMTSDTYDVSGIKVTSYYPEGNDGKFVRKLTKSVVTDSLKIYSEKIGEYPYKTFDTVFYMSDKGVEGMEYPGLCLIHAADFTGKKAEDVRKNYVHALALEIAHQWFYAAVGNDEYKEPWIDEGFASYCAEAIYWLSDSESISLALPSSTPEKRREEYVSDLMKSADSNNNDYINEPISHYIEFEEYGRREFITAPVFLGELREAMGDKTFFSFLRQLYSGYKFNTVTTKKVVELVLKLDDSKDVKRVIEKYISADYYI